MEINRERVKEVFREYTNGYDVADEKVKLKIGHTYRVAELCERIVRGEMQAGGGPVTDADADLAWLLGMLHDVGRFEQLRRYHTFIDAESVEHAQLGADILFSGKNVHTEVGQALPGIRDFVVADDEDALIETAVRVHSDYRIPVELPERTKILCNVLRDADKIDILRVNVETPLEEIYNTTTEALRVSKVSEAVMKSFFEHHAVLRNVKQTPVDHVAGHISLVYELVYGTSLRIVKEQGYLERLLHFQSENPKTQAQFSAIRAEMERYLADRDSAAG